MSSISTLLVSDASSEINSRIEKLIKNQPELNFESQVSKQLAPDSIKGRKNVLVWYELDTNTELSLTALQRLVAAHPSSYFIVSKSVMDPELVKTVMKVGVIDFLDYERADVQLKSVIRRISALHDAESRAQAPVNSAALEKRSMLKTSDNLMQTGKWADFDFKKIQEGAALADKEAELKRAAQVSDLNPVTSPAPPPVPAPPPAPAPAASSGSKWGDLDAIGTPGAKSYSQADSDSASIPASPVSPSSPSSPTTNSSGSWGDLDSIPTPKSKQDAAESGLVSGSQLGASGLGAKAAETSKANPSASKWGDLDSIGTPGAKTAEAAAGTGAQPAIDPFVTQPTPPPSKTKWGDLDAIGTPREAELIDQLGQESSAPDMYEASSGLNPYASIDEGAAVNPYSTSNSTAEQSMNASGSKWGDLDSIGTPNASPQQESSGPASFGANNGIGGNLGVGSSIGSGKSKWGDLDAIGTPQAKAPASAEDTIPPSTARPAAGSSGGGKWGDLDAIKAPEAPKPEAALGGGKWGDLDSIPTPKKSSPPPLDTVLEESTPARTPIVMGTSRGSNSASAKQRFGEHSEHGGRMTGLREGKSKAASVQIGWGVWGAIIAIILFVAAVLLAVKFFLY